MAASPEDIETGEDLRPEYDSRALRGVVRGKYGDDIASGCGWSGWKPTLPRRLPTKRQ